MNNVSEAIALGTCLLLIIGWSWLSCRTDHQPTPRVNEGGDAE